MFNKRSPDVRALDYAAEKPLKVGYLGKISVLMVTDTEGYPIHGRVVRWFKVGADDTNTMFADVEWECSDVSTAWPACLLRREEGRS